MDDPFKRPAMIPSIFYRDPEAALAWLAQAFRFRRSMVIRDPQGGVVHAEMRFGDGLVHLGGEWADFAASAASLDGRNTQTIHVRVAGDLDDHCARARQGGAAILQEPTDQFYGDRTYRARDLEGHVWTFSQFVRPVSRQEAEQATGLSIEAPDWD
jgi:uncharacterized glyoxalase superfamily protein PhnB